MTQIKKLEEEKIAVLAGGPSCEREISLISGQAVFEALKEAGHSVVLLDPVGDFVATLKKQKISFVFLALHGAFGEDGTVQSILENAGIGFTGSGVKASASAFDKSKAQGLFKKAGIRVPEFYVLRKAQDLTIPKPVFFPRVVKPSQCGSSVGISIVSRPEDYEKAVSEAFQYSDSALVEEYIHGRELTVGILGNQALPIVEVIAGRKFYDYEAKYGDAGTRYECPAKLSPHLTREVSEMASEACRVLGIEVISRADILLGEDGRPTLIEVNTIPGLTGKSLLPKAAKAYGIDFPGLCVRILELSRGAAKRRAGSFLQQEQHFVGGAKR